MPRGPKGERRAADVIGNAVHIMRIGVFTRLGRCCRKRLENVAEQ
jgi:hypothetical protein